MIYDTNCQLSNENFDQFTNKGYEGLSDLIRVFINATMQIERDNYLNPNPYERSKDRSRNANGYKPKKIKTRVGKVIIAIQTVLEGNFYPHALTKGLRSE